MILASLLLLAAAPAVPADNEIVVIARRLEAWRGKLVARRDGSFACKTTRSTGDRTIDAIGCQALMTCVAPIQAEMSAIARSSLSRSEKRRQLDAKVQATVPCIAATRDAGVDALVASRRRS